MLPDTVQYDLGPKCLQKLSADDTGRYTLFVNKCYFLLVWLKTIGQFFVFVLFDLILYVPSTIFHL